MRIIPFVWQEYALREVRETRINKHRKDWKAIQRHIQTNFATFRPVNKTSLVMKFKLCDDWCCISVQKENVWQAISIIASCILKTFGYSDNMIKRKHRIHVSPMVDSLLFDNLVEYTVEQI